MRRPFLISVLALALAAPLSAYTVYLKDGRTIQTKDKPRIVNGRALVVLLNGTEAAFDAREIDAKRTEEMNKKNLGAAEIIDGGPSGNPSAPAPQTQSSSRLTDLAARGVGPRDAPARRNASSAAPGRTASGAPDFLTTPRNPYPDASVSAELSNFFLGQKVEGVAIYQGTQSGRPLAEITTSSEGSVFKALSVGANAVLHIRDRFPQAVSGLELVMVTPARERAGQFVLTPDMAEDLVAKRVNLVAFYLDNVQF
ncbi:MAG TPA: hypothetical protein VH394_10730 [Thermoanaerobaculia bacterium]|jgi:hypothetical protein|nr:hypothetical protein [Thermoanaerobaculia bacterium]